MLKWFEISPAILSSMSIVDDHSDHSLHVDLRFEAFMRAGTVVGKKACVRICSGDWNPRAPIYFQGFDAIGEFSLEAVEGGAEFQAVLTLAGKYWPPVDRKEAPIRTGDFLIFESKPAMAELRLSLRLGDTADVVRAFGSISVFHGGPKHFHSETSPRIFSGRLDGYAHLYRSRVLPQVDVFEKVRGDLFVPIEIFLLDEGVPVVSRDKQVAAAVDLWRQCGIAVEVKRDTVIPVQKSFLDGVIKSKSLDDVRNLVNTRKNLGIPVIISPRGVSGGGGETTGPGTSRAIVVINDQDCHNDTLLAHELGHVLGNPEVTGAKTIMNGGETLCESAPAVLRASICEIAQCFACYRVTPL